MEHLSELEAGSIKGALEALLLVSSDPVRRRVSSRAFSVRPPVRSPPFWLISRE